MWTAASPAAPPAPAGLLLQPLSSQARCMLSSETKGSSFSCGFLPSSKLKGWRWWENYSLQAIFVGSSLSLLFLTSGPSFLFNCPGCWLQAPVPGTEATTSRRQSQFPIIKPWFYIRPSGSASLDPTLPGTLGGMTSESEKAKAAISSKYLTPSCFPWRCGWRVAALCLGKKSCSY